MMPTIRVDDDVFEGLKTIAEPFTDTPNSVIRRLLKDHGVVFETSPNIKTDAGKLEIQLIDKILESKETLTPQPIYEKYLHYILANEFDGSATKHDATKAVIRLMKNNGYITSADMQCVSTGETKAENTIAWSRNALKDAGIISQNSPRGVWELSEKGKEIAKAIELPTANHH